uniref:Uncharacterized protein n=1 Tax=Sinocyclocheilus grahami TaxID=75366 RepID=A0A672PZ12_SINGR
MNSLMHSVDQCDLSEDVTQQTVSPSVRDPAPRDPSCWTYYHKPIFILIAGGLALAAGLVIILNSSGLFNSHSTDTMSVNDEMGPLCFSVGLMFAVLGVEKRHLQLCKFCKYYKHSFLYWRMGVVILTHV